MRKIELQIDKITDENVPLNFFVVILAEVYGHRKLPVVIDICGAKAIMNAMGAMKSFRPLTHDLFNSFLLGFDIKVKEVLIHKLEEGIYHAKIFCQQGDLELELDSRTSDALAIAGRVKCPIYAYEAVVNQTLEQFNKEKEIDAEKDIEKELESMFETAAQEMLEEDALALKTLAELEEMLKNVLEREDYLKAAEIRDEIKKRQNK